MAQDVFIKIEGITGESLDATHKGDIEVLSWD
ncbi:Hemolysin-coregulated protein (putative) (plasmid) [Erwinia rhapontici]|nr:type VI secretion system (T6SS) effector Hcp [Erwinia rhapontici]